MEVDCCLAPSEPFISYISTRIMLISALY